MFGKSFILSFLRANLVSDTMLGSGENNLIKSWHLNETSGPHNKELSRLSVVLTFKNSIVVLKRGHWGQGESF